MVAVLRGANAPLLQRMIVEELAHEKSVLERGGERKTVGSETGVILICRFGSGCNNNLPLI